MLPFADIAQRCTRSSLLRESAVEHDRLLVLELSDEGWQHGVEGAGRHILCAFNVTANVV